MSLLSNLPLWWRMEEIVFHIFENCSKGDLARMASVSKGLNSSALDHLYREVTNLEHVLQFLAPPSPSHKGSVFDYSNGGLVSTLNLGEESRTDS